MGDESIEAVKLVATIAHEHNPQTKAMAVQTEAKEIKKHGTNQWSGDQGGYHSDNMLKRGVGSEYIAARLRRDHPDIAAAVEGSPSWTA